MERNGAAFPQTLDPTHHFHVELLDQRQKLRGQIAHLHKVARKLNKLRKRSLIANVSGSTLTAAGAVTAIVGLSLSPATLGASLLASAVGLGLATAGGAISISSDLSLVLCNSREVRKVQEIAMTCRKQMREILGCLEFLRRGQGPGDPTLRQSEKRASISLYNSVCFMVFCGSHSFLVPEYTKEVTKVSQAVLKAKIQKLAANLETCTRAMDEVCELLESRTEFSPQTRRLNVGAKSTAETPGASSWNSVCHLIKTGLGDFTVLIVTVSTVICCCCVICGAHPHRCAHLSRALFISEHKLLNDRKLKLTHVHTPHHLTVATWFELEVMMDAWTFGYTAADPRTCRQGYADVP